MAPTGAARGSAAAVAGARRLSTRAATRAVVFTAVEDMSEFFVMRACVHCCVGRLCVLLDAQYISYRSIAIAQSLTALNQRSH